MIKFLLSAAVFCICLFTCSNGYSVENVNPIENLVLTSENVPLFVSRLNPAVAEINFNVHDSTIKPELKSVKVFFTSGTDPDLIESLFIHRKSHDDSAGRLFGKAQKLSKTTAVKGSLELEPGRQGLLIGIQLNEDAPLHEIIGIEKIELRLRSGEVYAVEAETALSFRLANVVREAGQDSCDTYRIPGLVTTNNGTLIAVYDNRYNNSKDLQEDIDVGMSRSTDGGQNWEPMRVIMDMGEWGGRSQRVNGIGDPCVLYDHTTGTLWVAGLWLSGGTPDDMLWWSSKPGISPEETGQFMIAKSTDDGLTWSEPVNITPQIKDSRWQLLLQGPGRGITLDDGTLVFPAQFKADIGQKAIDGGQYTSHSTIVYSRDAGQTWHIGTGAKPNTTEAQVVQLPNGNLMLNMRDDRNRIVKDETNGRAVAVTSDFGKTWVMHPTSNSALPEPNCMASIISADVEINGKKQQVLFFSNPDNREARTNMTLKASLDNGNTWPEEYRVEINELPGFGYSCLTMVDENTVGILYEGSKSLYFQKVPVSDLIKDIAVKKLK